MGTPFFSIVMPVYQVEEYIHEAVQSALRQTFGDFELILVDDCSKDQCGRILDEYRISDSRIKVFHHESNKGLSAARNTGIGKALGRYILFWDSDDSVDCNVLEEIYHSIQKNPAQIVVYGVTEEYYNKEKQLVHSVTIRPELLFLNDMREVRYAIIGLETKTLYGYAWNKCYDLYYLKELDLRFEKIKMIEDIKFNAAFCQNINCMNILNIVPYHYKKRVNNSLTKEFLPDYYSLHRERVSLVAKQYKSWNMYSDDIRRQLGNRMVRYIYSALERNCDRRHGLNHSDRRVWLNQVYEDGLYKELIPFIQSENALLKMMYKLIQNQNTGLCLACGRVIYIVKNRIPFLFILLQRKR